MSSRDAAAMRVLADRGRRTVGIERFERVEIEIGTAPVAADDRRDHRALLVGRAAVDVDHAEEHPGGRYHHRIVDHPRHRAHLAVRTWSWSRQGSG